MITRKQALNPVVKINKFGVEQQVAVPVSKEIALEASRFIEGNLKLYEEIGIIANRIVKGGKSFGYKIKKASKKAINWVAKKVLTLNMANKALKYWQVVFAKRYRQALKILKQTQIYMAEMLSKEPTKVQTRKL